MAHVMELFGKARVVIKDGKVVEVGEPIARWCPIFSKVSNVSRLTREEAKKNMEYRIRELGMFTPGRRFDYGVFVNFGASEIMMTGLRRMLIETEPIVEIIAGIESRGGFVLDTEKARIDQVSGLKKACELGYTIIAVSVVSMADAVKLRAIEKENNIDLILIGAHLTGIESEEAGDLVREMDIITGCASKMVRSLVRPLIQAGTSVPMFGLTQKGKELILERAKEIESPLLASTADLPVLPEHKQPRPLL